jgi:benzoate membrane transport protein
MQSAPNNPMIANRPRYRAETANLCAQRPIRAAGQRLEQSGAAQHSSGRSSREDRMTAKGGFRGGWTLQPIVAALVAILAGYSGSMAIVFQAAQAAHLPDALVSSWVWAISLGCGATGIALSLITRAPISVAWSTPGAALLVLSLPGVPYGEAIGAYVLSSAAIFLLAISGGFDAVMRRVPPAIAAAMLSGILFRFGAETWISLGRQPLLIGAMLAAWLAGRRYAPRFAISLVLLTGIAVAAWRGQTDFAGVTLALAAPVWTTPQFSLSAAINLAIPLTLVAITGQYLPGLAVLRNAGYPVPQRLLVGSIGGASTLLAPFGCHGITTAAITAALIAGPEGHDNPKERWRAGVRWGCFRCCSPCSARRWPDCSPPCRMN